jgi:hypothetical protein
MAALLRAYPGARAVLFDQRGVVERAREVVDRAGVAERCRIAPGNFFESVPAGGDLYVLKSVLHNWEDAEAIAILKNCRTAMPRGSRLLIVERVVPEGNAPAEAKLFDINMLVVLGGLERTAGEYNRILDSAGFDLHRVLPTHAPVSLIEGAPRQL